MKLPALFGFLAVLLAAQPTVPPEDLVRGQELRGRTRMSGNGMVDFRLKVLSVMDASRPGESAVLAEILDPLFQETGVLAGMSGSPVWAGERLVGAVAFTFPLQKKPIVGITPIRAMLRLIPYATNHRPDPEAPSRSFYGMKPIATPLAVSGGSLDERVLTEVFPERRFVVVPGATGAAMTSSNGRFEPGDAIAVNLVRGDLNLTGYGTVTWVSNDWVLAFGHPMEMGGRVSLPIHLAEIDAVVPSLQVSFKVGKLGPEVGALVEDRSPAILGRLGRKAPRVPLLVRLKSEIQEKTLRYEIAAGRDTLEQFTPMLLANSLLTWESSDEPATLAFRWKIRTGYKDRTLELVDTVSAVNTQDSLRDLVRGMASVLAHLQGNRFVRVPVNAMEIEVDLASRFQSSMIEDLQVDRDQYRPGDLVTARVRLSRHRGAPEEKTVQIRIPASAREGIYPLIASSGNFFLSFDASRNPDRYTPATPDRLLDLLELKVGARTLSLWMFGNTDGLTVRGQAYQKLPVFQKGLLEASRSVDKAPLMEFVNADRECEEAVTGVAITRIRVEDRRFPLPLEESR
ncbi:MAG: hypothetical protein J0L75_15630 [Spirochaetes bacterium]|nr:hypothetical protein [Spirochaetota bacterium]